MVLRNSCWAWWPRSLRQMDPKVQDCLAYRASAKLLPENQKSQSPLLLTKRKDCRLSSIAECPPPPKINNKTPIMYYIRAYFFKKFTPKKRTKTTKIPTSSYSVLPCTVVLPRNVKEWTGREFSGRASSKDHTHGPRFYPQV